MTKSEFPRTPEKSKAHIMQLAGGHMFAAALHTVARLDIAELLAEGPKPVAELAKMTGSNEDALYRVMRLLVGVGVFEPVAPRTFALAENAESLRSKSPHSVRDMVLWIGNPFHFRVWSEMGHSVKTGQPAIEKIYGKPAFEVIGELPDVAADFNTAMSGLSRDLVPNVLDAYDFSGIEVLMDIAGGHGVVLCELLRRYPMMKGILFEIPKLIDEAKCNVCSLKMEHRCDVVAGNFFDAIPGSADAYYTQHIIHDWNDEMALKILRNVRQALVGKGNGKFIVVDCVLPENASPHFGNLLDIEMLLMPGGRERTEREFRDLFAQGGFSITKILPTKGSESVIEAVVAG